MFTKRSTSPFLLAGMLALGACDGATDGTGGRLSIQLTDAPGDLAEARVEITEIYLQGNEDENEEGGRVYLFQGSTGMIDLLELSGGRTAELVDNAVVPAGRYSQLRFRLGRSEIVTEDGRTFSTEDGTLLCPSCTTPSGLKVNLPGGGVSIGDDAEILVVDFDVSQSFGSERGRSGRWVMHPVMHATDVVFSGNIEGAVVVADTVTIPGCGGRTDLDLGALVPTATAGSTTKTGITDAVESTYRISFISPETYTLGTAKIGFENGDSLSFTATATPASVEVLSGETANADYQVTAVTCEAASSASS